MSSHTASGAPAITRRRRPFLAPVWLGLLAAIALAGLGLALWASASNTLVIIVPPAGGAIGSISNPPLSDAGGQQAQVIAQRFATATGREGLDAIYVSDTRRAQQTAAPLAQLLGVTPIVLSSSNGENIAGEILNQHTGDTMLVVCSSSAIGQLVHSLTGEHIEPVAQGDMYVISIPRYGPARILRMRN